MIFAIKYPEKVNRLILNGANLDAGGVRPSVQIPIVIGYKFASMFASKSAEAGRNAEMLGLMVNDPNINVNELAKIRARTLVIVGKRDMIKEKHSRQIFEHIPDAEMIVIPGNHFIAKGNPKAFNQAVENFLAGTEWMQDQ